MTERKAQMTDRERVEAILKRERPDRVPIWGAALGFPMVYTATSIADAYNKPEVSLAAQRKTAQDFDWVSMPLLAYAAWGGWEFGGDIKWPSGEFAQAPTVTRLPVETPEDAINLKMPDVKNAGIVPIQMEFLKLMSQQRLDNEPWNVTASLEGVFTTAGNICGPDKLSKWLIKKPEAARHLLRLTTDYMVELGQYFKDTFGTDGVLLLDFEPLSSNQIISPRQFEEFALPYIKEEHERLLAMGFKTIFMHICGEHNANLPYWAQIPMGDPGIISIGHEIELETAAEYFPSDIILGNLEPAIIQAGTSDEVYEATRKVVEKGKKLQGGYFFAPGCELPPMSKIENVRAMNKAINDFGWYD